jgi:hypothetical protein
VPNHGLATLFLNVIPGTTKHARAYFYGAHNWSGVAGSNIVSDSLTKQAYTVQLPNAASGPAVVPGLLPKGIGYGTLTIKPQGTVTAVGKYGDGTTLKWASQLIALPEGTKFLPIFSEPFRGGRIGGMLSSTNVIGKEFGGKAHWFRPPVISPRPKPYAAGFEGDVNVSVGLYTPPPRNTPAMDFTGLGIVLSDGPNGENGSSALTLVGTRFTPTDTLRSLTVSGSTGLFSGSMKVSGSSRSVAFKGVLNQGYRYGAGHFTISGETGTVQIGD